MKNIHIQVRLGFVMRVALEGARLGHGLCCGCTISSYGHQYKGQLYWWLSNMIE